VMIESLSFKVFLIESIGYISRDDKDDHGKIEGHRYLQFVFIPYQIKNHQLPCYFKKKVKFEEADVLLLLMMASLLPSLAASYSNIFQLKD
jgi:hypothetical protein